MAPTNTPRLALQKPDVTDLYDIGIPNANMDKLDKVGGFTECTSTTRPATPFDGQVIRETNTTLLYMWRAGAPGSWVRISPLVVGRRYNLANDILTTMANNTTEQLTGMQTGTVSLLPNALYRVTALASYDDVAGGVLNFGIRSDTVSGALQGRREGRPMVSAARQQQQLTQAMVSVGASGFAGIFVLTATRVATNATVPRIYRNTTVRPFMMVEYVGEAAGITEV